MVYLYDEGLPDRSCPTSEGIGDLSPAAPQRKVKTLPASLMEAKVRASLSKPIPDQKGLLRMELDTQQTPKWRQTLSEMDSPVEEVRLPEPTNGTEISQDAEWCEVDLDGETRRIRFHDYDEIYKIPGLYEAIFYESLKCCSPTKVTALLEELLNDFRNDPKDLKVLDLGAGNGMVGEELRLRDAEVVVGVDIIPEAKEATERDRPGIYDDYFVTDFTDLPEKQEETIRNKALNCLTSVSALGFGDIPPKAFIKALDLIETPGWAAFTIKEDFLREDDSSGFARLIRHLCSAEILQMQAYRRFRHRISMTGEPLYYVAMIAKKLVDIPDALLEEDIEQFAD